VEKVVICTLTSEHHEFQRKKGKTYFLAASAILFVLVTNGVILPREKIDFILSALEQFIKLEKFLIFTSTVKRVPA
jgi:hypothetical protein